jgi:hypothetical protein
MAEIKVRVGQQNDSQGYFIPCWCPRFVSLSELSDVNATNLVDGNGYCL